MDLYILQLSSDNEASLPKKKGQIRKPVAKSARGKAAPKRQTNAAKRKSCINDAGSSEEEPPQTRQAGQRGQKAGRRRATDGSSDVECLHSDADEGSHGWPQKHARRVAADGVLAGRKKAAKQEAGQGANADEGAHGGPQKHARRIALDSLLAGRKKAAKEQAEQRARDLQADTDAAVAVSDSRSGEWQRAGRGAAGHYRNQARPVEGDPFEVPCSNSGSEDASPEWMPGKKPRQTARTKAAAVGNKRAADQPRRAPKPQQVPPQPQPQKRAKPILPADAGERRPDSPDITPLRRPEAHGVPPVDLTREAFPVDKDPQKTQPGKEVAGPQLQTMIRKRPAPANRPGKAVHAHPSMKHAGPAAATGREKSDSPAPGISSMLVCFLSSLHLEDNLFQSNWPTGCETITLKMQGW